MMAIAYASFLGKKTGDATFYLPGDRKQPGRSSGDQCIKPVCGLCGEFFPGICVSSCRKRRKYKKPQYGDFSQRREQIVTELRVAEREQGFTMEFWGEPPEIYGLPSSHRPVRYWKSAVPSVPEPRSCHLFLWKQRCM